MIAALALGAIVFAVYVIAQIADARNTRRYTKPGDSRQLPPGKTKKG